MPCNLLGCLKMRKSWITGERHHVFSTWHELIKRPEAKCDQRSSKWYASFQYMNIWCSKSRLRMSAGLITSANRELFIIAVKWVDADRFCKSGYFIVALSCSIRNGILWRINQARFHFRLAVLGKLNNFVKEWIAEISELKVSVFIAYGDDDIWL